MGPKFFLVLLLFKTCLSKNLDELFTKINEAHDYYNQRSAVTTWAFLTNTDNHEDPGLAKDMEDGRLTWVDKTCNELATLYSRQSFNSTQRRQYFLLCRGPRYTDHESTLKYRVYEELEQIYSDAEVCIPTDTNISTNNLTQVDAAILNYLSNFKQFFNNEPGDPILFAAKIAAYRYTIEGEDQKDMLCLKGEAYFDKMMAFSRNEKVLRWLWLTWRELVAPPLKAPYRRFIDMENRAARRNGYPDIGATWREELEIPRLRQFCRELYDEVKHLYIVLHGVMRFYLRRVYGEVVPERGPIPAHLLGDLWSQDWEPLTDLLLPQAIDLDQNIKNMNWTVLHMVRRAADFYQSLGLPAMPEVFWRESIFTQENNSDAFCHGTSADMFQRDDVRMLYCAEVSNEDFYVLHHELGHIHYYLAYENQPGLYRGANSAFHETIGDSIMYGVRTPQHLNRLGLINDSMLYTSNSKANNNDDKQSKNKRDNKNANSEEIQLDTDRKQRFYSDLAHFKYSKEFNDVPQEFKDVLREFKADNPKLFEENQREIKEEHIAQDPPKLFEDKDVTIDTMLLLKQALDKIPQIPFSLIIDEYRWKYFEGSLKGDNQEYWRMSLELQGIAPPSFRGEEYFDAGAKFHVPDNTPYIRYFLTSFLQHQLFENLCKATVLGRHSAEEPMPETISLTRCDIYGSKAAGKILKDFMSRGNSQPWNEILEATTGERDISAEALKRYYEPLYELLMKFVRAHNVPLGW